MAPSDIPLDTAALVAVILESMLYGLSLSFFGSTIWALSTKRSTKSANRIMLGVSLLLLSLSTAHVAINIAHVYQCLIQFRDNFPGGPTAFCRDIKQPTFNYKNAVLGMSMAVADALTIYRVFVVWRNYWILGFLGILWTGVAVCAVGTEIAVSQNLPSTSNIFQALTKSWITSLWVTAFVCNASATACLGYRIWTISRSVHTIRVTKNRWWPFMRVILDSAALYCTSLMITLVVFLFNSNGQFIMLDMVSPIICISFYSIIIRVHLFSEKAKISEIPGVTSEHQPNVQLQRLRVHIEEFTQHDLDIAMPSGKRLDSDSDLPR